MLADARARAARGRSCGSAARSAGSRPQDAGLYRDALGAVPPGGLPAVFLAEVPDALQRLARRYAATHGPFTTGELRDRYALDPTAGAARARARRRGRARRAAPGRQRARVVRRRGAAAPAPRIARRAAQGDRARRPACARGLPADWQGVDRHPRRGAGIDRLREIARAAPGPARSPPRSGSATSCRGASARTRRPGSTSSARAARSSGSAPGRSGARAAGWRSTSARTPPRSARRRCRAAPSRLPRLRTTCVRERLATRRRRSSPTCWSTSTSRPRSCRRRCGISRGRAR